MEESHGKMVRLRLEFDDLNLLDKSQRSQGLRRCWFLLKPDITSIGDLASHIRQCFGLSHRFVLFMDDFVLPSFESTCIIRDKNIIRVKKKEPKQKDICKPCDGPNLLQDSENARENSVHLDPLGDVSSTKRKRKRSKKLLDSKGQYDEIKQENKFEPSNNCDVKKKKQARPLMDSHSSYGEEDGVASVVRPGDIPFQPREHGTQQADETQVGGAPFSDGILALPKSEVVSTVVDITKPHKHIIHLEILLPLRRLPVKGDILAYRYLEPSSSVYPKFSCPQVGIVSSFDYKILQIILLPVQDYVFSLDENTHGTIVQPNASRYKEDGSLEIEYLSLVDVRLVKAHGPEKACQDDQASKDNWEEALVKGSWNEPNASTTEQNNSWPQWTPNKSATTMSWFFKQPNAPFAGRGNGRTNWAPNRCMNTRIPMRNTRNWNPNRNKATWNPNRSNTRSIATDSNANDDSPWEYQQKIYL